MSLLHPRFMNELYPDPNFKRAARKALPAFEAMPVVESELAPVLLE